MATGNAPSADDFAMVDPSTDTETDDAEQIELDAGEEFVAQVRHIERDKGYNGLAHLTLNDGTHGHYWMNKTVRRVLDEHEVKPGDWILVRKTDEEKSFTNDDDEEETYYPHEVGVLDDVGGE